MSEPIISDYIWNQNINGISRLSSQNYIDTFKSNYDSYHNNNHDYQEIYEDDGEDNDDEEDNNNYVEEEESFRNEKSFQSENNFMIHNKQAARKIGVYTREVTFHLYIQFIYSFIFVIYFLSNKGA
jgi:hypothetical protein